MIPIKIQNKNKLESKFLSELKISITSNYENLFGKTKKKGPKPCQRSISHIRDKLFIDYLYNNIDEIIIGKPEKLFEISQGLKSTFPEYWNEKDFFIKTENILNFIDYIFDYKSFLATDLSTILAKDLNIKTCPYCNVHFTSLAKKTKKNGKIEYKRLFQYDHFFPQAKFPFLCLSLYNLIPCCATCNSIKREGNHILYSDYHPHVLEPDGSFNNHCNYYFIKSTILNYFIDNKSKLKIDYDVTDVNHKSRVDHHIEFFKTLDILEFHEDIINDLAFKIFLYYPILDELKSHDLFTDVFSSESDLFRLITNVYLEENLILDRPFGKVLRDLSFDLIKYINVDTLNVLLLDEP